MLETLSVRSGRVIASLLVLALLGAGCTSSKTTTTVTPGGVWKTSDAGKTWVSKRALVQGAKVTANAGTFSILGLTMDPQDRSVLYVATEGNGMAYSLDAGDSWQQAKVLNAGRVASVAVDPKNKCTLYAVMGNKIFKTDTCARDWSQVFFDPRTTKSFTQIAIDWFNPATLYAGSSDGDILKSTDGGQFWQVVQRVDGVAINSIVIDPRDSRVIYAGTQGEGIWKTVDGGTSWTQIKKQFGSELSDVRRVTRVVLDPRVQNRVYAVAKYGIIRSDDGGTTWAPLKLTTPPSSVQILALAIDPADSNHLVYTGVNTLVSSVDGGNTWSVKKLPSSWAGSTLLFDPQDSNTVYLGTQQVKN